jgi:hypothetical protein
VTPEREREIAHRFNHSSYVDEQADEDIGVLLSAIHVERTARQNAEAEAERLRATLAVRNLTILRLDGRTFRLQAAPTDTSAVLMELIDVEYDAEVAALFARSQVASAPEPVNSGAI